MDKALAGKQEDQSSGPNSCDKKQAGVAIQSDRRSARQAGQLN